MTLASVLALVVVRRLGLKSGCSPRRRRERSTSATSDGSCKGVAGFTILFEPLAALVIAVRLALTTTTRPGRPSTAGSSTRSRRSTTRASRSGATTSRQFVTDGWISLAICFAVIAGGLGFPVWLELRRELGARERWSLHTKLTLVVTLLLAIGFGAVLAFEWGNAKMRPARRPGQAPRELLPGRPAANGGLQLARLRRDARRDAARQTALMFIGAGSASHRRWDQGDDAGPARAHGVGGDPGRAGGQRVRPPDPGGAQRQALTVTLIALGAVWSARSS